MEIKCLVSKAGIAIQTFFSEKKKKNLVMELLGTNKTMIYRHLSLNGHYVRRTPGADPWRFSVI